MAEDGQGPAVPKHAAVVGVAERRSRPVGPDTVALRSRARRRRADATVWVLSSAALLLVVVPVVWILVSVVGKALAHWDWRVLTTTTVGSQGGLSNAIVGSAVIVAVVLLVGGTIGVGAGVYLAEYGGPRRSSLLRGASEVLSGVPSIVLGYVGYTALVVAFHWGFSLAAAAIVLTILVLPYIVKATEIALAQVPTSYREGATALGFSSGRVLRTAVLRPAIPGIATGLIVAVAIALGETAPLLYTAGWSDSMPTAHLLHAPIGYLPYAVWTFYQEPSAAAHALSHDAAFLLILLIVALIVLSRVVVARSQRYAPGRAQRHRRRRGAGPAAAPSTSGPGASVAPRPR